MRRVSLPIVVIAVALVLLADFLVVNPILSAVAASLVRLVVLVVAGVAISGAAVLAIRRARDLLDRHGDLVGAASVLIGLGVMLLVGLRPGSTGADDPGVRWLATGLLVPLGASLFAVLFVSTLNAARRALATGGREATLMVAMAAVLLVLLLPLGGALGAWLGGVAAWLVAVPIGGAFRGLLIGVAVVTAVVAARTALGIGLGDD